MKRSPLRPTPNLLMKLGSLIIHSKEALSENGNEFDAIAMKGLLEDGDVKHWLKEMDELALLPKLRTD